MIKKQDGFTLVELMITMIIFLLAMTAASQMFVGLITQFKQQSKIAETNTEGVIGLELLRADIEQAGFGLPWNMNGITYNEAANDANTPLWDDTAYNDASNPPRGIVVGGGVGLNGSDVLVLKATNIATNTAANKWTYITNTAAGNNIQIWGSAQEDLIATDMVTVLSPYSLGQPRVLSVAGGNFPKATTFLTASTDVNYLPAPSSFESTLIYGIASVPNPPPLVPLTLRMPFNRADYYIRTPGAAALPARCAPNTGILYKGVINHADGNHTELPLLDCVLDMRVVVVLDTGTGAAPLLTPFQGGALGVKIPAGSTSAQTTRDQAREIRVYIVAQEGQRDQGFTYNNPANKVGGPVPCAATLDDQICINDSGGVIAITVPDRNYRWKLYTLVSTPYNLKQ